jgi:hypothetical protein
VTGLKGCAGWNRWRQYPGVTGTRSQRGWTKGGGSGSVGAEVEAEAEAEAEADTSSRL